MGRQLVGSFFCVDFLIMKARFYCFLVFSVAVLCVNPVHAGELQLGKEKVKAVCQTCHGVDGIGTIAGVPNLSGQKRDYLVIQLKAYRASRRQHAQMSIIAQMLSDEDIQNVATWYSSIKVSIELPE
ncbi:MAG: cytochrome c553 [Gammaproteobacteria bacterium]|jgi:cytochrome c553